MPGTLEFTTSTALRYRRSPTPSTPPAADPNDALVATAVAHAHIRAAQEAVDAARMERQHAADSTRKFDRDPGGDDRIAPEYDSQDRAWRRSQADRTRHRIVNGAAAATRAHHVQAAPPF